MKGILQILPAGHGFLRDAASDYNPEPTDPRVPRELIEKHALETGLEVEGMAVPSPYPNQAPWLAEVQRLNGLEPEAWKSHTPFKNLTAEDPTERIRLELEAEIGRAHV